MMKPEHSRGAPMRAFFFFLIISFSSSSQLHIILCIRYQGKLRFQE